MTTSLRLAFASSFVLAALVGCSNDDNAPQPAHIDKASTSRVAQSTITSMQGILTAPPAGATNPGLMAVVGLANSAQAMENVAQPDSNNQGTATQSQALSPELSPADVPAGATGTCNCTDTSCTFQQCSYGGVVIDGNFSWAGGHVQCQNLKFTYNGETPDAGTQTSISTKANIDYDCDFTVTATSLDGSMHSGGSATVTVNDKTVSADWNTTVKLTNVTYPKGGGMPTGGSAHVDASISASGNVQSASYAGSGDVTFP